MAELSTRGVEVTSRTAGAKATSLHTNIEEAIRNEMRHIRASESHASSTLRADLRSICANAKKLDMRAELLIIAIKKVWQEIPQARSYARPIAMDSLLNEVVTMTLDEFYRNPVEPSLDD